MLSISCYAGFSIKARPGQLDPANQSGQLDQGYVCYAVFSIKAMLCFLSADQGYGIMELMLAKGNAIYQPLCGFFYQGFYLSARSV